MARRVTGPPVSKQTHCATSPLHRAVPQCVAVANAAVTACSVSFAALSSSHQNGALARNKFHVCSRIISRKSSLGSASGSSDTAGWVRAVHCAPVPYDNHRCEHRLSATWLCTQRSYRLPSVIHSVHLHSRLVCIECHRSNSAWIDFPSLYATLILVPTLHEAVVAAHGWFWSAPIRNSGSPPFNVVPPRLAWPLSSPLSRTLSLGPSSNPLLRRSTKPNFPAVKIFRMSHRMSRSLLG